MKGLILLGRPRKVDVRFILGVNANTHARIHTIDTNTLPVPTAHLSGVGADLLCAAESFTALLPGGGIPGDLETTKRNLKP